MFKYGCVNDMIIPCLKYGCVNDMIIPYLNMIA